MRTTGPSQAPLLLLDVIDVLNQPGIRYMIVGAIAAAYHGVVRASRGADAAVSLPAADLRPLADTLRSSGLVVRTSRGALDDPIASVFLLTDAHGNAVDLLWQRHGQGGVMAPDDVAADSSVDIIGPEDFIAMKPLPVAPKTSEMWRAS
jgi:hypothetical protein